MSRLTRFLLRRQGYLSGRPEPLWRELIARHAPGRTFVDVGCMWRVNGAYAFHALASGAAAVTGIDVEPATAEFERVNAESGGRVRFHHGDLNDPALEQWAGSFDVVFCSGVLYHVPDLVFSLRQLRRLCRQTLILATASTVECNVPNAAVFLPFMDPAARAGLAFPTPRNRKVGFDSDFAPDKGYGNWVWLPTPSCVRALLQFAGFTVQECHAFRRVTTVVAVPTERPG